MNLDDFKKSISKETGPAIGSSVYLQALWYDAHGNWNRAHDLIDDLENPAAYRLHAYLHRKEGDASNAGYWYRRAGLSPANISLDKEWELLVREHLGEN